MMIQLKKLVEGVKANLHQGPGIFFPNSQHRYLAFSPLIQRASPRLIDGEKINLEIKNRPQRGRF